MKPAAAALPRYLDIHQELRRRLAAGEWPVDSSLPSESALSALFSASRITVRHALRLLEEDGLIRKEKARRPVVTALRQQQHRRWMIESIDDIIAMAGDARLLPVSWAREISAENARLFGLSPRTPLWCLRSVLMRDGRPMTRSIIWFPPDIGSRLAEADFDDPIIFRVVIRQLGIVLNEVGIDLWAEPADATDASMLGCATGQPLLVTRFLYHDETGRLVEIAYSRRHGPEARFSTHFSARSKGT